MSNRPDGWPDGAEAALDVLDRFGGELQRAEQAAQRARFTPTTLNGQPVKVQGVITYNFVLQ